MRAAVLQSLDGNARAEIQNARAFRSMKFVRGERERVEIPRRERLLSKRLDRIAVKKRPALPTDRRDRGGWMQCPRFVVRRHDGNERRLATDRIAKLLQVDMASRIHRQLCGTARLTSFGDNLRSMVG